MSFPAVLAAVAARGPRCIRCAHWTMDPDQTSYTHPMCDTCATTLEELRSRFLGVSGPADQRGHRLPDAAQAVPTCRQCAVWECRACNWRRKNARRGVLQVCTHCGRTDGRYFDVRHWKAPHTHQERKA